jgi:hypothetical protein
MKTLLLSRIHPVRTAAVINSVFTRLSSGIVLAIAVSACGNNQTAQPKNYPDKGTPQAELYMEKCSQCHAAPLPDAHTARIWPSVLQRMQLRMKTKNVTPLTRKEMSIILGYLQQHAKPATTNP